MKEYKITIKLNVVADERDKELMRERVYEELQEAMENEDLSFNFKAVESDDDEEDTLGEMLEDLE